MAPKAIIVTGSDTRQFRFADMMLRSLARHGVMRRYPIGFLDAGLTEAERRRLPSRIKVVPAPWQFDFPIRAQYEKTTPGLSMLSARMRVRDMFPDYDVYVWIDADTVLQDPTVVDDIVAAAAGKAFTAAYELDRVYTHRMSNPAYPWRKYAEWYRLVYPGDVSAHMVEKPMINCGVYALAADAPHWSLWDWLYQRVMKRIDDPSGSSFMADQLSMNVAVHYHKLPIAVLSSSCNWLCHLARPMWDAGAARFCAPLPPFEPLRIVHFSGRSKSQPLRVAGLDGGRFELRLRHPLTPRPIEDEPDPPEEADPPEESEAEAPAEAAPA